MTVFYVWQHDELTRLEVGAAIGRGGEGTIYSITAPQEWLGYCIKEYVEKYRTAAKEAKLQFMVDHPPEPLHYANGKLCWPVALAYDAGFSEFVGYVMPLAYTNSQELYLLSNLTNKRLGAQWQPYFDQSEESAHKRLNICVNLCTSVQLLHQDTNYAIVDFKPQNIMFTADGKVALVDLDSLQIRADESGEPHYGRVNTLEYTPPEGANITVKDTLVNKSWDEFSLAVILYQILFGIHPYMATFAPPFEQLNSLGDKIQQNLFVHGQGQRHLSALPSPHNRFNLLHDDIQQLFRISFDNRTDYRASATLWQETLAQHIQQHSHGLTPPPVKSVKPIKGRATAAFSLSALSSQSSIVSTCTGWITALSKALLRLIAGINNYQSRQRQQSSKAKLSKASTSTATNKSNSINQTRSSSHQRAKAHQSSVKQQTLRYQKRSYGNNTPPSQTQHRSWLSSRAKSKSLHPFSPAPLAIAKGIQPTPRNIIFRVPIALITHYPAALISIVIILCAALSIFYRPSSSTSNQGSYVQVHSAQTAEVEDNPVQDNESNSAGNAVKETPIYDNTDYYPARPNRPYPYDTYEQLKRRALEQERAQQEQEYQEATREPKDIVIKSSSEARFRRAPNPELPQRLLRTLSTDGVSRATLKVTVRLSVNKQGEVTDITIQSSSGHEALDRYTLREFKKVKFYPFMQDGKPVNGRVTVPIVYLIP